MAVGSFLRFPEKAWKKEETVGWSTAALTWEAVMRSMGHGLRISVTAREKATQKSHAFSLLHRHLRHRLLFLPFNATSNDCRHHWQKEQSGLLFFINKIKSQRLRFLLIHRLLEKIATHSFATCKKSAISDSSSPSRLK